MNNSTIKARLFLLFLISISTLSFGQASGTLDATFNTMDRGSIAGVDGNILSVSTQSDGKIIISGDFYKYDNIVSARIARLLPADGSLDTTFNTITSNAQIKCSVVLSDDKILLAGVFTEINGAARNKIARLNADGTLDTSFDTATGFNGNIWKIKIQPDGKILAIGGFTEFNGVSRNSIIRLNADGSLDTSFDIGTGVDYGIQQEQIYNLALQNDGKIVIVGSFLTFNGMPSRLIARLNPNGSFDNTFAVGSGPNCGPIESVASQNDGKVIISGCFTNYCNSPINQIARLNTDGTLDTTFHSGSGVTPANMTPAILDIAVQDDNKILFCGSLESINGITKNKIVRLNTDGSIDENFNIGTGFLQITDFDENWGMQAMKILSNGKIIVTGKCAYYNGVIRSGLALLNTDGSLDNVFNASYGADKWVMDVAMQSNNKILIAGGFDNYDQTAVSKIAQLNQDGTIDTSFNPQTMPTTQNAFIRSIAIQSDGKVLVTRNVSTFIDNVYSETAKIERLNTDGTADSSFSSGIGANNIINKVVVASNGKIYALGNFTTYNGSNINRIVRLNNDGTVDTSFNVGVGPNSGVLDLIVQNDNKIVIAGNFTTFNTAERKKVARLNSNGTLDTSFFCTSNCNHHAINSIAIQTDGKIVLGTGLGLKRLHQNGTVDNSFDTANLLNTFKVLIQSDGKILAGGLSTLNAKRFFKFNNDGTIDTEFDTGIGITESIVSAMAIQSDDKIIVGGDFRSYGISKDRVIRINNQVDILSLNDIEKNDLVIYPNPTSSIINISSPNESISQIDIYDLTGRVLKSQKGDNHNEQVDIQDLPAALYILEVLTEQGNETVKVVKR